MADALALYSSGPLPGSSHLVSDQRLTRLAKKGDRRAFSAIYRRYHQDLYRYCQAILGDPHEAEDALQSTMVKVLAALPGETREIQLRPWLYRIAHNEAIEVVRRRRPADPLDEKAPSAAPGLEEAVERRESLRGLIEDLGELPERQRGAVVMRELGGMSFQQIGSAFGTSAAVVRQTVYEARVNLQQISKGREMVCAEVRQTISDGDGRVMRRRDVRAHLRGCQECRDFRSAIATRKRDLTALAPLPAAASASLLHGVLGGVGQGSGGGAALTAAGGGAAKGISASVALKSAAAVTAVTIAGASAAQMSGLVHLPRPGGGSDPGRTQPAHFDRNGSAGVPAGPDGVAGPDAGGARAAHEAAGAALGSRATAGAKDSPALESEHNPRGAAAENAPPGADSSPSSLPAAASRGQETAASHGRESAPGQARAHSQGAARGAQGSKPHPTHPAHPAKPPHTSKPSPSPKPPHQASGSSASADSEASGSAANGRRRQGTP